MDFTEIALEKFNSTFPELAPFIVSFQELKDDTEEADISAGLFIIRVGASLFFVPVISKGDTVYPIDSIFNPETNKFFPLSSKFVKQLVNSSTEFGTSAKVPSTVVQNPSIYQLVNPPKTGKQVYASVEAKLTGFLASMPDMVKQAFESAIIDNPSLYKPLHKLFGIDSILAALKRADNTLKGSSVNMKNVCVLTEGDNLSPKQVVEIIDKGYTIVGGYENNRVAYAIESNNESGHFEPVSSADCGNDFEFVMADGSSKFGTLIQVKRPMTSLPVTRLGFYQLNDNADAHAKESIALFEDGTFSYTGTAVSRGGVQPDKKVLVSLITFQGSRKVKDVERNDSFLIINRDGTSPGHFEADMVYKTEVGTIIKTSSGETLTCLDNYTASPDFINKKEIILSADSEVVLVKHCDKELEHNAVTAFKRYLAINPKDMFSTVVLGYNNGEFSYDRKPVGGVAGILRVLIEDEHVYPSVAETLVKKASEKGSLTMYMSKQADVVGMDGYGMEQYPGPQINPLEMPRTDSIDNRIGSGQAAQSEVDPNKLSQSMALGDSDIVSSSIISELLQNPYLYDMIDEYLPEIELSIDRLGRIITVMRLKISELSKTNQADDVFAFVAQLRSVYKMLGESYLKLKALSLNAPTDEASE